MELLNQWADSRLDDQSGHL